MGVSWAFLSGCVKESGFQQSGTMSYVREKKVKARGLGSNWRHGKSMVSQERHVRERPSGHGEEIAHPRS